MTNSLHFLEKDTKLFHFDLLSLRKLVPSVFETAIT